MDVTRIGVNKTELYAAPLPYRIYYEPAYYGLRFPDIDVTLSTTSSLQAEQAFYIQISNAQGELQQASDLRDEQFLLEYDRVHSFLYSEYVGWARCMAEVGCVEREVTELELIALESFYEDFAGDLWRFNDNWLVGDPCTN